jgi:hypothetical protein
VDIQYTPRTAKSLVPTSKVDGSDSVLAEHGGAHDTGLNGDIQIGLVEDLDWMLREDTSNGDELGVPGAVQSSIRLVHTAADDFAVLDEDTADWCLIAL